MISLIKDHIISKIRGLINIPFEIAQKKLRPLINLEKFNNEEVIFVMSQKDVKSAMGNEVLPVKIETDSVLLKVFENGSSNDQILSFSVDKNYFVKTLLSNVGLPREKLKNQHVLVEFSSPNIAKPFHIGHLRSTIVGNFVANCCKSLYGRVTKLNYLGDWGVQVGYVKAGLEDLNISTEQLSQDPIRLLYKAYVDAYNRNDTEERAKSFFSELEHGTCSEDNKVFWENVRELSMNNLRDTYSDLEIKFDEYCYESDYKIANIKELLKNLESHGVAKRKSPNDLLVRFCRYYAPNQAMKYH
ncbi:hypothetical protein O3M35_000122 [Rhynocoris fuscipes]|uniref:Probable arginine--tRNA ligase, mitochondrial n=1 Tax=Rhynocoris fuscipes TaxID=488301 RepID=A0AAW1DKE5_9HEMI